MKQLFRLRHTSRGPFTVFEVRFEGDEHALKLGLTLNYLGIGFNDDLIREIKRNIDRCS